MSHFVVVVLGDNVDEQLAPYDENMVVEPYSTGILSQNEIDRREKYYREDNPDETKDLTFDELIEKFGTEWVGDAVVKREDGTYENFATYNPNSKWDWYVIGGRWTGYFKIKPDGEGMTGTPGVFGNQAPEGTADIILKKHIDIEAMRDEDGETAAKKYDLVFEAIKDTPVNESWESVRARIESIDEARNFYHAQPRLVAFKSVTDSEEGRKMFGWNEDIEDYNVDRETFIQKARNQAISPFAIVKDGEWYEKGEMGWWGMSSNEMTQEEWNAKVNELFDSVPDDTIFTAVDCHI